MLMSSTIKDIDYRNPKYQKAIARRPLKMRNIARKL
jgi:hypothetical protein